MTYEALLNFATSHGHDVLYMNLTENKAVTIEEDNRFHITLAKNLSRIEEIELTAHELGHCEYGGTYCRRSKYSLKAKAEYRANKWAYYTLTPPDAITAYVCNGIVTPWDLAEQFDVSYEFMSKALEYYKTVNMI